MTLPHAAPHEQIAFREERAQFQLITRERPTVRLMLL
jgi:hypothetical protein